MVEISQADAVLMLDTLRNLLRCYDRDTVPTRRVETGGLPGTLVKVPDATAAGIRELVARLGVTS